MIKPTRLEIIKNKTIDLAKNSSINGLPNMVRSERLSLKIMWLIVLIGSSSACIYFVISCLNGYFEYEYITSIKTIPETPSAFPAISICSYNNPKFEFTILLLKMNTRKIITK